MIDLYQHNVCTEIQAKIISLSHWNRKRGQLFAPEKLKEEHTRPLLHKFQI